MSPSWRIGAGRGRPVQAPEARGAEVREGAGVRPLVAWALVAGPGDSWPWFDRPSSLEGYTPCVRSRAVIIHQKIALALHYIHARYVTTTYSWYVARLGEAQCLRL